MQLPSAGGLNSICWALGSRRAGQRRAGKLAVQRDRQLRDCWVVSRHGDAVRPGMSLQHLSLGADAVLQPCRQQAA